MPYTRIADADTRIADADADTRIADTRIADAGADPRIADADTRIVNIMSVASGKEA